MIDSLRDAYPVRWLCQLLGVPPSSYYYVAVVADELTVLANQSLVRLVGDDDRVRHLTVGEGDGQART